MSNKVKITITIIALVVCGGVVSVWQTQNAEDVSNLHHSKNRLTINSTLTIDNICAELTKSNSEGQIYELITGRYLKKKSRTSKVQMRNHPVTISNTITLVSDKGPITLYSGKMTQTQFNESYSPILKKLIYDSSNAENNTYGICAYKDKSGKYINDIRTLTLVKEG